jgi:hypothetical protein
MKKQQAIFPSSLASVEDNKSNTGAKESNHFKDLDADDERHIGERMICRCGAQVSDSPLCFLGHVQCSRILGKRHLSELSFTPWSLD